MQYLQCRHIAINEIFFMENSYQCIIFDVKRMLMFFFFDVKPILIQYFRWKTHLNTIFSMKNSCYWNISDEKFPNMFLCIILLVAQILLLQKSSTAIYIPMHFIASLQAEPFTVGLNPARITVAVLPKANPVKQMQFF